MSKDSTREESTRPRSEGEIKKLTTVKKESMSKDSTTNETAHAVVAPARLNFVSRIRCARDVHSMTASTFAQLAQGKRNGDPKFTLQEHFNGRTMVRPYYDFDAKFKEPFTSKELEEYEKGKCLSEFRELIGRLHPGKDIVYAERHGVIGDPNDSERPWKYKISYRAWVLEVRMIVMDIPKHARTTLRLSAKECHPHLDLGVYKPKEQLLGVIYGCKDIDSVPRFLRPLDKTRSLTDYLAQNVEEHFELLSLTPTQVPTDQVTSAASGGAVVKKRGRPRKAESRAVAGTGTVDAASSGDTSAPEILSGGDYDVVLSEASMFFGFQYRMQETLGKIVVQRDRKCLVFPTTKKWCFIKMDTHAGNNPYILVTERGARFKCLDDVCKTKDDAASKLILFKDLPALIRDLYKDVFFKATLEETLMVDAKKDCKDIIRDNYPDEIEDHINPEQEMSKFITKLEKRQCLWCGSTQHHQAAEKGWYLQCENPACGKTYPTVPIPIDQVTHPRLYSALQQLNVIVNNNVTINNFNTVVNNTGGGEVEFYADYSDDAVMVFEDQELNMLFIGSLQGTDTTLSRFTTCYFKDRFHCTSQKRWYKFEGHCWSDDAAELAYKEALNKPEFLKHYQQLALRYENMAIQNDEVKKKARMLRKLSVALEDGKQRDRIVMDSIMKFHEMRPRFDELLNTQNVMVFEDGVYDFDTFTFGPGTPDRPITMCVPQPYVAFDADNEHVQFLLSFLAEILPDPEVREYLLKVLGTALTLDTSQQHFYILTGKGGNGKGKLMTLVEDCLGDYYQPLPPALLTRKREDANQANEALMVLQKARCAVAQEAESSEVIQSGTMKALTGQDTLSGRQNYGRQVKLKPKAKFFLVVNDIPRISENTMAVWRRVKVIDFPMHFVESPDPALAHQRQVDYSLDKKLKEAARYFIPILIHYYQKYVREGLREPQSVSKVTECYKDSNDVVKSFVSEHLARDPTCEVTWREVSETFKRYSKKIFKTDQLKGEFKKQGCVYLDTTDAGAHFRGFRGWKLIR